MKIIFFSVALCIAFSATTVAQKTYTQGVVTYNTSMRGQDVEIKEYFTADSTAATFTAGPATINYCQMPVTNLLQYWLTYR